MPRGDARTRLVNIPKEFLPLIEAETENLVFFSQVHTMGVILSGYFNRKKVSWRELCQEANILPTAPNSLRIKQALAKHLTFADEAPEKSPEQRVKVKES